MKKNDVILNRYKLLEVAGSGGFGEVCVAWDRRIQRKVAVKCIELSAADVARAGLPGANAVNAQSASVNKHGATTSAKTLNNEGRENTTVRSLTKIPGLDEARTAATLSDANIVSVYDFEIQNSTAFLIMEYVDGVTLEKLLECHGEIISINAIAAIVDCVAHALEIAHEAGVLHLDIKPANILIDKRGQVKVTDFGLATLADAAGQGRCAGGTIGYMPPEQISQQNLDARTDQWALACVTYLLLCGENPFLADNLKEAKQAIENGELLLPSVCWDGMDASIDDVMFDALDPNPKFRFESVEKFAEALLPFLGDCSQGKQELSELVAQPLENDPNNASDVPITESSSFKIAVRCVCVLLSCALCTTSLQTINSTSLSFDVLSPILWIVLVPVAALTIWKPYFGLLASICVLAFSFLCNGAFLLGLLLLASAGFLAFALINSTQHRQKF